MDPFVALECQAVMPDRFGLVLAAAARARSLREDARAGLDDVDENAVDTALRDIALGVLGPDELRPFLPPSQPLRLAKHN
ncbi:DNA-directed RNA polymerase subunit omega [Paracoccus sp. 22332]|uniref:DNA-directed RNA polymerase subunit omega n=1 Tax=Paracoccus sp. 22332 TaxID=3453913 RepID=UPI003F86DC7F